VVLQGDLKALILSPEASKFLAEGSGKL